MLEKLTEIIAFGVAIGSALMLAVSIALTFIDVWDDLLSEPEE